MLKNQILLAIGSIMIPTAFAMITASIVMNQGDSSNWVRFMGVLVGLIGFYSLGQVFKQAKEKDAEEEQRKKREETRHQEILRLLEISTEIAMCRLGNNYEIIYRSGNHMTIQRGQEQYHARPFLPLYL